MLVCHGIGVDIEAGDSGITIKPRGFGGYVMRGATGSKFIAYGKISAVQLKAPGLTNGFIQFTLSGGTEKTKGIFEATRDENSVIFTAAHLQDFERLRTIIMERSSGAPVPSPTAPGSMTAELASLADLLARGLLTDQEFAAAKARLLGTSAAASPLSSVGHAVSSAQDEVEAPGDADFLKRVDEEIERQRTDRPSFPSHTFGKRGT